MARSAGEKGQRGVRRVGSELRASEASPFPVTRPSSLRPQNDGSSQEGSRQRTISSSSRQREVIRQAAQEAVERHAGSSPPLEQLAQPALALYASPKSQPRSRMQLSHFTSPSRRPRPRRPTRARPLPHPQGRRRPPRPGLVGRRPDREGRAALLCVRESRAWGATGLGGAATSMSQKVCVSGSRCHDATSKEKKGRGGKLTKAQTVKLSLDSSQHSI